MMLVMVMVLINGLMTMITSIMMTTCFFLLIFYCGEVVKFIKCIIQIFISTLRHELADHIFCIPMSNCLIADTEVPENAHMAYRVKFLLNEMIMSKIFWM